MDPLVLAALIAANGGIITTLISVHKRTNGNSPLACKLDMIDKRLQRVELKLKVDQWQL